MAAALFLAATGSAFAQESTDIGPVHLDIQNVAETDWGLSTAGKGNRWNDNFKIPGSGQGLSTDGNTLQVGVFREDSLFNARVAPEAANMIGLDNIEGFVHGRFYSDISQHIDGDLPNINLMNFRQRYPGNGWSAYTGGHEYEFDAAEAYTDWRKGPLWLRLGKQYIVYGEELGLQTLDNVDSMDFRRNPWNYSGLEFSDLRIATWAARLTYDLGDALAPAYLTDTRITSFISEFQPTMLTPPGSTYNSSLQANLDFQNSDINGHNGLARARHKLVYGAVIESNFMGLDWSANFYSTPEHIGYFRLNGEFAVDPTRGVPTTVAPGVTVPLVVGLTREMPRIFMYGGMVSYMIQPVYDFPGATLINGDLVRLSMLYTPNKAFGGDATALTGHPKRIGDLNIALDIEKNYRWSDKLPSAYFLVEYNYRSRSSVFDNFLPAAPYRHKSFNFWVVSITQPLPMNRWSFVWVHEMEGNDGTSWYMQPAVVYKPTSAQEYRLFWNFCTGTNRSNFGGARYLDAIIGAAIYKF